MSRAHDLAETVRGAAYRPTNANAATIKIDEALTELEQMAADYQNLLARIEDAPGGLLVIGARRYVVEAVA